MKTNSTLSILFPFLLFISSCSTTNKILIIDDPFKEQKNIKLLQLLDGYSDEQKSFFLNQDYHFNIKTVYSKPNEGVGNIILQLKLTTTARPEELDSVLFLLVDSEKFKLESRDYVIRNYIHHSTSTETATSVKNEKTDDSSDNKEKETTTSSTTTTSTDRTLQTMKHTFEVPAYLWGKIEKNKNIMLRAYIEDEGVDIKFNHFEKRRFSLFFARVLEAESSNQILSSY